MAIGKVKKGALHKQLGMSKDAPISSSKLESLKNSSDPKTRKRANFALNARKWKHGGKRKKK